MAVSISGGNITPRPPGIHEKIPSPSDHDMVISQDVLSWNILCQCKKTPDFNNNGFGVTESDSQYINRLKWIADSIADTLESHPSIKSIALQEVPTNPSHLKIFQEALSHALKQRKGDLSDRFPIKPQTNVFFEETGMLHKTHGPPTMGRMIFFDVTEYAECINRTNEVNPAPTNDNPFPSQRQRISAYELHRNPALGPPQVKAMVHAHFSACRGGDAKCIHEKNILIEHCLEKGYDLVGDFNTQTPEILKKFSSNIAIDSSTVGKETRVFQNNTLYLGQNTDAVIRNLTPEKFKPIKPPETLVQLQASPAPKIEASAHPLTFTSVSDQYANASLTPSFPNTNTAAERQPQPLTFSPTLEVETKETKEISENAALNTTLDKKITRKRAEALWSSIKQDPDFKKSLQDTIRGMGGKSHLTYDIKDRSPGLKNLFNDLLKNLVLQGIVGSYSAYRREGDFEAITLREGVESGGFLESFETGKQLSHWLSAEDKVDVGFDKIEGKIVVTSHPTAGEGTPNTKVLVATSFAIAQKEHALLIQEKIPDIVKKYKEQYKNLDEDPNKWPSEILQKVNKEAESLITQAEKDQIYSFNISYCESYKNLIETLQSMAACVPPLTAKFSKNVEIWLEKIDKKNDPTLMRLLEKTKPPHQRGAKAKPETTEAPDSSTPEPDKPEGAGASLKRS